MICRWWLEKIAPVGLVVLAPIVAAQAPPATELGRPLAAVSHEFSQIDGVAELTGGRLLVADRRDRMLYLVLPATGQVEPLGRRGQGPGEYHTIFGVVRWRGDTLLVYDSGNRRLLKIDPAGRIAGTISFPSSTLYGGIAPPRGADARGHIYWGRVVVGIESSGDMRRRQTLDIVRWLPGSERLDTVAAVADHAPAMHDHRFHPFAERDAWIVGTDGRIGVLVAADFRLRWLANGRTVAEGPRLAPTPVPVTATDRNDYREWRARNPAGGASVGGGEGGSVPMEAVRRQMAQAYPDAMFPLHKPPFEENGAWHSPGGDIWVARSKGAGERVATVDVLDARGALKRTVRLPPNTRVVALERGGIYLVRIDNDDLEYLQHYAWPEGLR